MHLLVMRLVMHLSISDALVDCDAISDALVD